MIGYEINKLFHRRQTAWFLILLFAIHMIGMWKAETPGVEKYADYTVDCNGLTVSEIARRIERIAADIS
jgi:hypothetical protein